MRDGITGGMPAKLSSGPRVNYDLSRVGAGLSRGPGVKKKTLPAAAWSNTWPAPGSTLDLDFANNRGYVRGVGQGGVMDAITFTRASSGTWVDSTGLLRSGAGTFTGTANAEGKNLLTFPQDFENAAWSKLRSNISLNSAIAPDGTLTANKLIEDTSATNTHLVLQNTSVTAGLSYTLTTYIKKAERGFAQLRYENSGHTQLFAVNVNLTDGSFTTTSFGSPSGTLASVSSAVDGWWRVSITATANNSVFSSIIYIQTTQGSNSYTGDGTSGVYIWGAQLELGSSATTYYPTNINAPRFDWASTAQLALKNLIQNSETISAPTWISYNPGNGAFLSAITAPDGTTSAQGLNDTSNTGYYGAFQIVNLSFNTNYTFSVFVKQGTNTTGFSIWLVGNNSNTFFQNTISWTGGVPSATGWTVSNEGSGWYRLSYTFNSTFSSNVSCALLPTPTVSSAVGSTYFWGAQLELGSSVTPYQPVAQPTTITPLAANTTSNGLLIEESRTNRLLWCRDATQSNWTKTNVTAAKNQTGVDGVANAASSLTASADNGTCIQTITLASGSRTCSVYLKRITGTGTVQVSLDGSTWSTVDLSNGLWNRIVLSGTVTNPVVGIRIATNGDAVAMDYGQVEDGAFATSPILTTTATVTRAQDAASMSGSIVDGWFTQPFEWAGVVDAASFESPSVGVRRAPFNLSDLANSFQVNKITLMYDTGSFNTVALASFPSNVINSSTIRLGLTEPAQYVFSKIAFRFKNTDFFGAINGASNTGLATGSNVTAVPQSSPLRLFQLQTINDAQGNFNGYVRGIKVIPGKVSNAALVELSK